MTLTATTTAWCKQHVEVMLAIFPRLKLHTHSVTTVKLPTYSNAI